MSLSVFRRFMVLLVLAASSLPALDKVRAETRSDQASAQYGVSGKGVIYAMIDRGIDWQNNDFRNADGTTRIAYIFDLTDNTGANASNNPYGAGTIYTQAQINRALQGGTAISERDYLGHGTANTAVAAGNGNNVLKYHGIAPEATIITVKLLNSPTPAYGSTPAVPEFQPLNLIPTAIQFVVDKAKELNMPVVMLMDIGSIGGPTDGTSTVSRTIDAAVGNQPGVIFIAAAGDDGSSPNHAEASVPSGGSLTLKLKKEMAGGLHIDMWYAGADAFDVKIQTPDTSYGPFRAPANNTADFETNLGELAYYQWGANVLNSAGAINGKREMAIVLNANSPNGEYSITLIGRTVVNGHFDITMNPSDQAASALNYFENYVVPGSISDYGATRNAVVDTCYVIRTNWISVNGGSYSLTDQGTLNNIWTGTSIGPTFDGRRAIDVSAPAETIMTAYDPKSYWASSYFVGNEISDGKGLYGAAGANSSSNPVTGGIIALMLQLNPKLDAFTVKDILHKSARSDSFTGAVPNTTWGYGKIDAVNALGIVHNTPRPIIGSVVNGASFASGAVSPGEMFTIFGSNLGPATLTFHDDLSWDQRFIGAVNGTEVLFDGVPAAMVYTSAGQITGVVPYAVGGETSTQVQVLYEGVASQAVAIPVAASDPAFFMAPGFSKTQVAANNADGTPNSPANPESRGNTLIMFATGEGQTNPAGIDGALANTAPYPKPVLPVSVTVGGVPATVQYYGAAPGELAGVMQLNVEIPANAPTGTAVPVSVTVGTPQSPANATLSIR
jgi:minor extracellular serine protease Vpr